MDRYRDTVELARRRDFVTAILKRSQRRLPKKKRRELILFALTVPLREGQYSK